jgi:hypothetical protein
MRIVEFESQPEYNFGGNGVKWEWHSKVSVDLDWVAGAQPHDTRDNTSTSIVLAGSNHWFAIRINYSDFMTLWRGNAHAIANYGGEY